MHLEHYHIARSSRKAALYEFTSTGPKGDVIKAVLFTATNLLNFYNLGFGDLKDDGEGVDDLVVTDNSDTQKVLTTVARIVMDFTELNPDAMVFATGSTPARTRLYRMGITGHLAAMEGLFTIYGLLDGGWELFKRGENYEAFYVIRKK